MRHPYLYAGRHRAHRQSPITVYDLLASHDWHVSTQRLPRFRSWLAVEAVLRRGIDHSGMDYDHERASLRFMHIVHMTALSGVR